jgi:hypothetical protein
MTGHPRGPAILVDFSATAAQAIRETNQLGLNRNGILLAVRTALGRSMRPFGFDQYLKRPKWGLLQYSI